MANRTFALDEPMDPSAPKGSAPWARAVHVKMTTMLQDATTQLQRFRRSIQLFEAHRGWQQLDDAYGHPFPSFRAFCTAKKPHGLGYDPHLIEAVVQETREMTLGEKMAETHALQAHGANQHSITGVDNINSSSSQGGTSRDYLLARLKRDSPDIFAALERQEYPSVRAAAKAAGLVHDPPPLTLLQRAWMKASHEERAAFLRWTQEV